MMMNCIIIDDEPLARKGLKEYIDDIDFITIVGEYDTPLKVMEKLADGNIHLIFLDIHMPKLTGIEFLKNLQNPPIVIITTAYPQYALEGFELAVLDYLVKPISFNRFVKAVLKAKAQFTNQSAPATQPLKQDYIFIKADNKLVKILHDDILFIEAMQNYVTIYTKNKKYITYLTFKGIEENLPAESFLKVHKSYIVQIDKVDSIEGGNIAIGENSIPVSRTNKDEIMQKILNGRFLKR